MTSYTPGPWTLSGEVRRVGDADHYCADICGPSDGGFWRGGVAYIQTADHLTHGMRIDEGKANAALIAAAPDLLASVKDAFAMLATVEVVDGEDGDPWSKALARMEAVIAKAEGRFSLIESRQPASLSASQKEHA